ncbi:hypothetical protein PAHAL_2G340900 [Panicum hallii]|uniref:Uncharacterized protein n=1 Tax=Panicum hallii TaxID=206008 RepID=A0A2T8KRE7_9POAL|nr:hypothetical protein PAHAL_2G340900 [Panicum hallii]
MRRSRPSAVSRSAALAPPARIPREARGARVHCPLRRPRLAITRPVCAPATPHGSHICRYPPPTRRGASVCMAITCPPRPLAATRALLPPPP